MAITIGMESGSSTASLDPFLKLRAVHGIEQFERGQGVPRAEAEKRLRKKHGFSR